jgi:hypothetical protein
MDNITKGTRKYHGLEAHNLEYISVNTQHHLGVFPPHPHKTDSDQQDNYESFPAQHYHGDNSQYFLFQSVPPQKPVLPLRNKHGQIKATQPILNQGSSKEEDKNSNPSWYYEPCGIRYLDRLCFEDRGEHEEAPMPGRSKDLFHTLTAFTNSSKRFMRVVNLYMQEILLPRVVAAFPDEYESHNRTIYRISALNEDEERRPGCLNAHTIMHKLPVQQHLNSDDADFCVLVCTGSFEGGYVVFPDLNLVFLHRPGDILIFRSKILYHGVTTWVPKGDVDKFGVTPGRTSHMLHTKSSIIPFFKGKGLGWAHRMGIGEEADPMDDEPRVIVKEDFQVEHCETFRVVRNQANYCSHRDKSPGRAIYLSEHVRNRLLGIQPE